MEKVYISGPITGTNDYMERFSEAEEKLKSKGYIVVNPARVNACLPEETIWEEYMSMSKVMLSMCSRIYFLTGWEHSKGARMEARWARESGIRRVEDAD